MDIGLCVLGFFVIVVLVGIGTNVILTIKWRIPFEEDEARHDETTRSTSWRNN